MSGKRRRCSSASGRLEHVPSILSELALKCSRDKTGPNGKVWPDWVVREILKQNRRRHSLALGSEEEIKWRLRSRLDSARSFEIDENISLESLQKLRMAFEELETRGCKYIDERRFGQIVKKSLALSNTNNEQVRWVFKKIDFSGRGRISWEEFSAHILQKNKEKEQTTRRGKQVAFNLPASTRPFCQGCPVINIHHKRDSAVVTVQEDGTVRYWSPQLKPQMTKYLFKEEPANRKSKWASDFTLMHEYNKLLVGTGDREIQLYELSTLEPYCQINTLDTIPLTLDYGYTGSDQCCLLYGDTEGCVNIILISSAEDTLRLWNKFPKLGNIPSLAIDNAVLSPNVKFVRWKVHRDWVTQVMYDPSLQAVISSSNDEASSLVIGCVLPLTDARQQLKEIAEARLEGKTRKAQLSWSPQRRASCDQRGFSVHKGVKTFDLCRKRSLLVTGGMDRLIRMWNPLYSGHPTGILTGHLAPVAYLCISSEDGQIFSVSSDCTVKIWHIEDHCCLFTADPEASGIHGDISACLYSPAIKSLYAAADSVAVLSLEIRPEIRGRQSASHLEPVTCCGYSEEFRQVVSCAEGSVKVWDFDTGRHVFEFAGTCGLPAITCMTFDSKGSRLITGCKDGSLKIWNFNTGDCIKTMKKDGGCHEVRDCIFLKVHQNSYVMSVGRERKIDIYSDIPEDLHHVQRPQPSWQDDLVNGHKEDILCIAHCPPSLLATSSFGGEIIIWNVVSGRIRYRFVSPPPDDHQNTEELDVSVPCIIFHKDSKLQLGSPAAALLSSGATGCINFWEVHRGGKFVSSFRASRFGQKITKMAESEEGATLYAADQIGYVYVYDLRKFAHGDDLKLQKAEVFWRAHTSRITGLQVVDREQAVLTSSTDFAVRLWSTRGEFIGTFGQPEGWCVHIPSSWMHPAVPYEILTDPLSMLDNTLLKTPVSESVHPKKSEADKPKALSKHSPGFLTSY